MAKRKADPVTAEELKIIFLFAFWLIVAITVEYVLD